MHAGHTAMRAAGVDVIFYGTIPTPLLYYAAAVHETDGGMQITGSHNPPEYNGFKMIMGGRPVYGPAIQGLREPRPRKSSIRSASSCDA